MKLTRFFITALLLVGFQSLLYSQIEAPESSMAASANTSNQSVFVFCDINNSANQGALLCQSPDGKSDWSFTWTQFDAGSGDFTIDVKSEDNVSSSQISGLLNGTYRLVISRGVESVTYYGSVINNYNQEPSIAFVEKGCSGVIFESDFANKNYQYLNVSDKTIVDLDVSAAKALFVLKYENQELVSRERSHVVSDKVFLGDGEAFEGERKYYVEVTDAYNCSWKSSEYSSDTYIAKAGIEVVYDVKKNEAPLTFNSSEFVDNTIVSESINGASFKWYFFEDEDRVEDPELPDEDKLLVGVIEDEDPGVFTYEHPGKYFIKLVVESQQGCIDEFTIEKAVEVDTSLVQVPNVFTPNGDGINDIFYVKGQSLKNFHATIYNRWGRSVYDWNNPSQGWNGKVNGKEALPGTYFYVVTATGREVEKKKYVKKGSFMLIRGR